jgi:hypothetical protein
MCKNQWIAPTNIHNQRCLGAPKKLTETSAVSRDVQIREEMTKLTDGNRTGRFWISYSSRKMRGKVLNFS